MRFTTLCGGLCQTAPRSEITLTTMIQMKSR